MSPPRHIDQNARMVWLSLRRSSVPMTVGELVIHWRPVFTAAEMEDCLKRLVAAGHATHHPRNWHDAWSVSEANAPLPDFVIARKGRPWSRTGAAA